MNTDIGDRWIPKRGKDGKQVAVRNPLRGLIDFVVEPLRVVQIYNPDRAVLLVDSEGRRTTIRYADLRKHWRRAETTSAAVNMQVNQRESGPEVPPPTP